jgi:hypothetical protein
MDWVKYIVNIIYFPSINLLYNSLQLVITIYDYINN